MFIVDSLVHIWRKEALDRPWSRERPRLDGYREEAYSYECVGLMDEAAWTAR